MTLHQLIALRLRLRSLCIGHGCVAGYGKLGASSAG
jgi:hypothetical protein